MRIGVDARHLGGGRGVARYAGELLDSLAREHPDDRWLLFAPGRARSGPPDALERLPNVALVRHPLPGRALFGAAALTGRPRLDRLIGSPLDVLWVPAVAPLAISARTPFVLTVHDISFELRPQDFTPYERAWHRLARPRALAARARLVIVPAGHTRAQLVTRWGLPEQRVRVVPEGVFAVARESGRVPADALTLARWGLTPGRYLLAVGALEPRKAPLVLTRAFARARAAGLTAELALVGRGRLASGLRGPGVRLLGGVSDSELDALYAGALALVVPSLLEGYGLPLREALARGTPAIVSDLPVFGPELSPAVIRVAPADEPALADALLRIARDDDLRARLAAAAPAAVAGLSWSAAAKQTRAILAEAAALGL